jgi:hypothetical protein
MVNIDYSACLKKIYPEITSDDFAFFYDEDGLRFEWYNEATFGLQPSLQLLEFQWLEIVKVKALAEIKLIRALGLDKAALSPGILAIYNQNYEAAMLFMEGKETEVLKTGMTVYDYLAGFGSRLGLSVAQFAGYIIGEYRAIGPTVFEVEKRYLALSYGGDIENQIVPIGMYNNADLVQKAVDDYRAFCQV